MTNSGRGNQEALIATGFNRLGAVHREVGAANEELNRQSRLNEMATIVGPVFLGLTVGCARCHNHKFDPILQSDYYRLQGVFAGTENIDKELASNEEKTRYAEAKKAYEARLKPLQDAIAELEKSTRDELRAKKLPKLESALQNVLMIPAEKRTDEQKKLAKDAEAQLDVALGRAASGFTARCAREASWVTKAAS